MRSRLLLVYGVTVWVLSLSALAPAWPAPSAPAPSTDASVKKLHRSAHKAKKPAHKSTAQPRDFALVQNIRVKDYPGYTRLVLDLDHTTTFTQGRQASPDRAVVELQNARLSDTLRTTLAHKKLPGDVFIAQPHARSVTVSVNLSRVRDYKLIALSRPERLVVDLYHQTEQNEPVAAQPIAPPPPASTLAKAPAPATESSPPAQTAPAQPVAALQPTSLPPVRNVPRQAKDIKLIVIDPGHGGKDPGAVGQHHTAEKDVTLQVGLKLRDLITKHLGVQVLMTRDRDLFVELGDRAKFANSKDADLFVSIHVNSHPQRNTRGLEVYHFGEASDRRALEVAARENGTPLENTGVGWQYILADFVTSKKIEKSQELAWTTKQAMVAHLDDHYDVVDHGVKTAPFYVIRFTTMPSILAEIAFISNPAEEKLMRTDTFTSRIADAIFQGIRDYVSPIQTAAR